MIYEFEFVDNVAESVEREGAVDHNRVTRWFEKFFSDFKKLEDLARRSRSKVVESEAVL